MIISDLRHDTHIFFQVGNGHKIDPEGTIIQLDQARGINKALMKMVDYIVERSENSADRILGISHCNCRERAEIVKDAIIKRIPVKDVVLLDTAGVSSMYANDGGIIVVI